MSKKKKTFITVFSVLIVVFVVYILPGVLEYAEYIEASAGCSWQEGGTIAPTFVMPPTGCVIKTPATFCVDTCPTLSILGGSCALYSMEIPVVSQLGTTVIGVPRATPPKFLGSTPKPGSQFLSCGATNIAPWVIALPSPTAMKVHKVATWFDDVVIAAFHDKK